MYLLDTDVLVEASKRELHRDICPAFWDWLEEANRAGLVASIERVYDEVTDGQGDEANWARSNRGFFGATHPGFATAMTAVSNWANNHFVYTTAAKAEFLGAADSYLVAYGLASGAVVVTRERPETPENRPSKIKIPSACDALGVRWTDPASMFRTEGARFILER